MATVNSSKFNIVVNRTTSTVTSQVNSNKFNIVVNRANGENELGVNGKANTQVIIYKGGVQLTPVNSTPKDGQFKISIDSVQGCTAAIKNNDTVYINTLTEDTGTVIINITLPNGNVIKKYFTVQKSVALSSVKDIETRVTSAEQKITDKAITSVVKESQFIKDMNGKITTNTSNISEIEQTATSISSKVTDLSGKYTELKQTVDGIDMTGKVSFSDLSTTGKTTINGSNITTGTINGNLANITNINASNITSGTISGNRISGGVIEGSTLKTSTPTSNGGVWIKENAIQLGSSNFLYEGNTFKIETNGNTSYSSTANIHLMPGMRGSTASGNGIVYVSGKISANSLTVDGVEINPRGLTAVFG